MCRWLVLLISLLLIICNSLDIHAYTVTSAPNPIVPTKYCYLQEKVYSYFNANVTIGSLSILSQNNLPSTYPNYFRLLHVKETFSSSNETLINVVGIATSDRKLTIDQFNEITSLYFPIFLEV